MELGRIEIGSGNFKQRLHKQQSYAADLTVLGHIKNWFCLRVGINYL